VSAAGIRLIDMCCDVRSVVLGLIVRGFGWIVMGIIRGIEKRLVRASN